MQYQVYDADEYVFHMGDEGDKVYIVLHGAVHVFRPNPKYQPKVY